MKRIVIIIAGIILLFSSLASNAQDTFDYFVGNWNILVNDTPSGDVKMVLHLERIDGKLTGTIKNEGIEPAKLKKVEETESSITIYYSAVSYDLYMTLTKKDTNSLVGRYMNMFDVKGERETGN